MRLTAITPFVLVVCLPAVAVARPWYKRGPEEAPAQAKTSYATPLDSSQLRSLLARLDGVRATRDSAELATIDGELLALLDGQLDQGSRATSNGLGVLYRAVRTSVEEERVEATGVGDAYADAAYYRKLRSIKRELARVADRTDDAAIAFRRVRIARLIGLADRQQPSSFSPATTR